MMLLNYLYIKDILFTKKFKGLQGPSSQTKGNSLQFSAVLSSVLILSQADSLFNKLRCCSSVTFHPLIGRQRKSFFPKAETKSLQLSY